MGATGEGCGDGCGHGSNERLRFHIHKYGEAVLWTEGELGILNTD